MHRYNIDGTLREETEAERREREARHRGPLPISDAEALRRAKGAISGVTLSSKDEEEVLQKSLVKDQGPTPWQDVPWHRSVDKLLFGRDGEAPFKRSDPRFNDFKEFYKKYRALHLKKLGSLGKRPLTEFEEIELGRNALVLFQDFLRKKLEATRVKVERDRASLPIKALESEIVETIRRNQVVLIAADTGAGKSTQVPQFLLSAGFDKIACTQPRRIACYSLAKRVSYESLNQYGSEVAYKVRFEGTRTDKTKILFLTEGVLLRQYVSDPLLSSYNVIIVDEVHERHVTGDFLLGVLKKLVSVRPDVRVVLMSATINADLFSQYFKAPVIEVPGRMFPVSIEYIAPEKDDRNLVDPKLYEQRMSAEIKTSVAVKSEKLKVGPFMRIIEKIDHRVPSHERGDLLIFLSGINEIALLSEELQQYANYTKRWIVLSLHSSLSAADQERVFDVAPPGIRKCILSTNLAETSVTIDGIRFIIDSGKVKEIMYDPASRLSRLQEFWVSQSSSKQRAGRAGRTGPGECYRLYSKNEFDHLNDFPVPEILRTCLDPLLLQVKAYGLGDPRQFDFIERPSTIAIEQSLIRLQDLGSLDAKENLTILGNALALLPVDVVLGKMLILGSVCDIVEPILVIAAALSVPSPFIRVSESQTDILANRKRLFSDHGDPFTLLNLYSSWLRVKTEKNSSRKWCQRHGVEEQRLYELVKLKEQFGSILKGLRGSDETGNDDDEFSSSKKRKEPDTEQDYWMDPEYKRKREQRFQLVQQKHKQTSTKRKMLKFQEFEYATGEDDNEEPSINELEFSLKHDADTLLSRSDVNVLSSADVNLIKLVLCSGLYPNIAISDSANYARKLSEQAFHTNSKKFLSMHPTSVFSYSPESIQPAPPWNQASSMDGKEENLANLHGRIENKELLCYLQLLETNKPYLTNVFRIHGLHSCLLFARSIDINHDMTHFVVDNWLHLHIPNSEEAQNCLVLGNWLQHAWNYVIEESLKHAKIQSEMALLPITKTDVQRSIWLTSTAIPKALRRVQREWNQIVTGEIRDLDAVDVSVRLGEFLMVSVDYNIERLKTSELHDFFGYDPYGTGVLCAQITPSIRYFFHRTHSLKREADVLKEFPSESHEQECQPEPALNYNLELPSGMQETNYHCPVCHGHFSFSPIEILRHRASCKK